MQSTATGDLLTRLTTAPKLDARRFAMEGEVGQGGMGVVLKIHDCFLNRRLAMKVLLERSAPRDADEQRLANQLLGRFLEEAQVTSQLDHPGVVPVHELGLDQNGKVFFTMRLVKGRTASAVFADSFSGSAEWPLTRALEVVLKVCDTVAYAHDKGVLHRDLKPSNVMVGRFGEVYVMDWGLAKVLGQADRHDLRIARDEGTGASRIESARKHDAESDSTSSVVSMDGQQLGTPSYMAPEQARSEELDQRADVYSVGAMLYELLAGRAPYVTPGVRQPAYRILNDVVDGPPKRIEQVRPGVPAELVAIVDKAMARDRAQRFASVAELANDLRAFLAQRVVKAYRTGALVEMKLWMRRNKALAASLGAAVLILVLGVVSTGAVLIKVEEQSARFQAITDDYDQLGLLVSFRRLMSIEETLGSVGPAEADRLHDWMNRARKLLHERPAVADTLHRLRQEPLHSAEAGREARQILASSNEELLAGLPRLETLLEVVQTKHRWVLALPRLTLAHPNAKIGWAEARAAIAKADGVVASELYAGQDIPLRDEDVWGLVPIGMNPQSKLWEFYDLRSAWDGVQDPATMPIPVHQPDGRIRVSGDTGIVFVLLPGGTLPPGTKVSDQLQGRRLGVELDPFLASKFELTVGQFSRLASASVWQHAPDDLPEWPATNLCWTVADATLRSHGLVVPSELQWEFAARGGTHTTYWTGEDPTEFRRHENLDRHVMIAVGSMSPNPFGLFDVGGNAWEWCNDVWGELGSERDGDGMRPSASRVDAQRTMRGGGGYGVRGRPDWRQNYSPGFRAPDMGVRPVRGLRTSRN